jgi:hypothetical protein
MDAPCWALGLPGDCRVSAKSTAGAGTAVSNPSHFTVTYEFPARGGRPPCILKWYNNDMPVLPPELGFEPGTSPSTYGFLIMGDKGAIYMNDPYCTVPRLLPEPLRLRIRENPVPRTIPRVPDGDQYAEWIRACQGIGPAPGSNIVDHSGLFLETILLGNIAIRTGRAINYDAAQGVIPDDPEAGALLTKTYRKF